MPPISPPDQPDGNRDRNSKNPDQRPEPRSHGPSAYPSELPTAGPQESFRNTGPGERLARPFGIGGRRDGAWCSGDLPVLPLESAPVRCHRLAVALHVRAPLGHPRGVGLLPLSLEPLAVRRVPRRRPRCPSAPRRRAVLAVGSRPASATVRDLHAAGGAGLHPMNTSPGRPVFSVGAPREFFSFISRDPGDGCGERPLAKPDCPPTRAWQGWQSVTRFDNA